MAWSMDAEQARAPHQDRRRRRGREERRARRDDRPHASDRSAERDAERDRYCRRRDRSQERPSSRHAKSRRREMEEDAAPRRDDARGEMSERRDRDLHHDGGGTWERRDVVHDRNMNGSGGERRGGRGRSRSWPRARSGSGARRSKVSVPDNWADVAKMGSQIGTSRFVAMRVPLDDKYSRLIRSEEELWTPEIFLQTQASDGHDVRLLIDLTNTTKYYDGEVVFRESDVKYVKLKIEGFKAPPRETEVEAFVRIVDEFVASEPKGAIAVHCTHGLNRTGYLVVSYLVRRSGMSVQDALKAFSDARPPGLIKHMYVEDLYRRFAPDDTVVLPQLPSWAAAKYAGRR